MPEIDRPCVATSRTRSAFGSLKSLRASRRASPRYRAIVGKTASEVTRCSRSQVSTADRSPSSRPTCLPAHVQDPSDLAAQGLQLRFGGRPGWEIVEVAHLSRQQRSRPANLPDERTQGGQVILEPVPSKAALLFASEAPQALQGLLDFRPCGQGRQPHRIKVPWTEARAVPRPRSTIERGSDAEECPGCIILHRPTRTHLVR